MVEYLGLKAYTLYSIQQPLPGDHILISYKFFNQYRYYKHLKLPIIFDSPNYAITPWNICLSIFYWLNLTLSEA